MVSGYLGVELLALRGRLASKLRLLIQLVDKLPVFHLQCCERGVCLLGLSSLRDTTRAISFSGIVIRTG